MAREIRDGVRILSVLRRAGPMGLARRLRSVLAPRTYCAYWIDVETPQAAPVSSLPGAVPRVGVLYERRAMMKSARSFAGRSPLAANRRNGARLSK